MRGPRRSLLISAAALWLLGGVTRGQTSGSRLFSEEKRLIRYGVQEVWTEKGKAHVWRLAPGDVCCRGEDTLELGNVWVFTGIVDGSAYRRGLSRVTGEIKPKENNRPALVFGVTVEDGTGVVGGYALLLCEKENTGTILWYRDLTAQGKDFRVLHVPEGKPGFPETEDEWVPFRVTIDGAQVRYEVGGTVVTEATVKDMDSRGFVGVHCLYDHPKYPPAQVLLRGLTIEGP